MVRLEVEWREKETECDDQSSINQLESCQSINEAFYLTGMSWAGDGKMSTALFSSNIFCFKFFVLPCAQWIHQSILIIFLKSMKAVFPPRGLNHLLATFQIFTGHCKKSEKKANLSIVIVKSLLDEVMDYIHA